VAVDVTGTDRRSVAQGDGQRWRHAVSMMHLAGETIFPLLRLEEQTLAREPRRGETDQWVE
jgi:hypothetical protein